MGIDLDDETLQIFLEESTEHLDGIENDFLAIEEAGDNIDDDLVNKVFRAIHSVKGGAGFFAFDKTKDLAHAMENLLGLIRKHELSPTSEIIDLLLKSADILKGMIEDPATMDDIDISEPLSELKAALTGTLPAEKKETVEKQVEKQVEIGLPGGPALFTVSEFDIEQAQKSEPGGEYVFLLEFDLINDIQRKEKTPWAVVSEVNQLTALIDCKLDITAVGSLQNFSDRVSIPFYVAVATSMEPGVIQQMLDVEASHIHQILGPEPQVETPIEVVAAAPVETPIEVVAAAPVETPAPVASPIEADTPAPVEVAVPEPPPPPSVAEAQPVASKGAAPPKPPKKSIESSIRVHVNVIDQLMNLAGELVLARNQLVQGVSSESMDLIDAVSQRVDLVTTELQDTIMKTRMQSIGIVFGKFQRIVRDLSKSLAKQVDLVLEGEDVELDKTIIEAISDPLTHLVRNSVDHGVEVPADRISKGKPATGTLKLSASHKAGQVLIEIIDDGAGIYPEVIKEKAISMGLYTPAQLSEMSDNAIQRLIFHPGFSTAKKVTDVSGRGVGMDVVHSNLSKLGGVVDIDSTPGKGTTMRITLPLTLAIIPSLLISTSHEKFAIPQHNLVELVRIPSREVAQKIEKLGDAEVMRLRGELLPLIYLEDVLEMEESERLDDQPSEEHEVSDGARNIAVVAAGDFHYGLVVENLLDSAEIVVKPLGKHLMDCRIYAGATILGDGRVASILDVVGISQKVRSNSQSEREQSQAAAENEEGLNIGDMQSLLVVENGPDEQFAVPLGLVERIERIHRSQIVSTGGKQVLKYRGGSLALLSIEDVAEVTAKEELDCYYVIIFRTGEREAGLLVSRIVDITETALEVDDVTHRQPGVFGSVIIGDTITQLVDPQGIASTLFPEFTQHPELSAVAPMPGMPVSEAMAPEAVMKKQILVVEDSKFFLKQIKQFLEEAGYDTFSAMNGLEALDQLEKHLGEVDLVLTDIEMPEMDGFEMCKKIREDDRFKDLPVVAVTSVMGEEAEAKGKSVGIDQYLIKLDREQILDNCQLMLENGRTA